jgi:hypothetical protein
MKITNSLRGAMRRIAGVSFVNRMTQSGSIFAGTAPAGTLAGKRRTLPLPSILNTYGARADDSAAHTHEPASLFGDPGGAARDQHY